MNFTIIATRTVGRVLKKLACKALSRLFPFKPLTSLQRMLIVSIDRKKPVRDFWTEQQKARIDI